MEAAARVARHRVLGWVTKELLERRPGLVGPAMVVGATTLPDDREMRALERNGSRAP